MAGSGIGRILLLPVWLLQIGSSAKSFAANPILGSRMLNRLGLHAVRVVAAQTLTRLRHGLLAGLASREDREAFLRDGYIVKTDFLPPDLFDAVEADARGYRGPARECHQGDTITNRVVLDEETLDGLPACRKLAAYRPFRRLLKFCAARNEMPFLYIERVRNHAASGGDDPQCSLHSDTFQPTIKAWLFLDDVDDRNGPFTYVPGSHRLSGARLAWEYRKSVGASDLPDGYSRKGSLRCSEADLGALGLPGPRTLHVGRNTLVVANTHGFHCRGRASERTTRLAIWAYSRPNPFNPFVGFDSAWLRRIEHRVYRAWLRHQDRRAARNGTQPSWRLVDARDETAAISEE
jgi:hypothetical protein